MSDMLPPMNAGHVFAGSKDASRMHLARIVEFNKAARTNAESLMRQGANMMSMESSIEAWLLLITALEAAEAAFALVTLGVTP